MKGAVLYGVLLLAHGGAPQWNADVEAIRKTVDAKVPAEAALGMADDEAIQGAIDRLEARGVQRIVAVPIFVNSASEVLDQTRFLLGLRKDPSQTLRDALANLPPEEHARMMKMEGHHRMFSTQRVKHRVPLSMAPALDDSKTLAEILLARAKALSKDPRSEAVVLVAHGPVDDKANDIWLATLGRLAQRLRSKGGFAGALVGTLRDDSVPDVKDKAIEELRKKVSEEIARKHRLLVVPVLIARGGIEDHVIQALTGLDYAWSGETICPDPRIAGWIEAEAAKTARDSARRK